MKVPKDNLSEPVTANPYYRNMCALVFNAGLEEVCSEAGEDITLRQ